MRWKSPSDKTILLLLFPIIIPLGGFIAIVLLPFILLFIVIPEWIRKHFGPGKVWEEYYAWRPIKAEERDSLKEKWVWLETIERRNFYGRTLYRFCDANELLLNNEYQ